jgi:hypothetical protein
MDSAVSGAAGALYTSAVAQMAVTLSGPPGYW